MTDHVTERAARDLDEIKARRARIEAKRPEREAEIERARASFARTNNGPGLAIREDAWREYLDHVAHLVRAEESAAERLKAARADERRRAADITAAEKIERDVAAAEAAIEAEMRALGERRQALAAQRAKAKNLRDAALTFPGGPTIEKAKAVLQQEADARRAAETNARHDRERAVRLGIEGMSWPEAAAPAN